ncbi:MAG: tRNA (guanine-N(1)-)-methyltransferase [Parcubacteria group bacterium GW2011_GWA1_42_7]|nr:MAG: tRNA (guanine-N(1)-)-methyltransferase [Parcubacteria group bacterium GW2011_GWB1_42_6]KKS70204.1 MAG: tRNA (guanine-N(1)-)-methyltransferase [Parcubacteria group bacterium GW2011_GWA1_42_7]KKS92461.1 MAG: tRNA (guanine-N(1)-)-methyltransferase, tRNA (guanine-N1-)-methyltransferase [Parcubacteria group bacterium GW2011_GWC1_43_12]
MKFDIITIFPKIFDSYFGEGMIRRAREKEIIKIEAHDLRQWTQDKHKSVDDKPYGGGPGMVMMAEPIYKAVKSVKDNYQIERKKTENQISRKIILFSAKGKRFSQADARRFAKCDQLILICGRYEGVDERVAEHIADEEISIGEFVLTGGEIPAMIMVDAVSRLIPGVLGKEESLAEESFSQEGYAEYPQYTRPEEFMGWKVPDVLLSGDHKKIEEWKKRNAGNN